MRSEACLVTEQLEELATTMGMLPKNLLPQSKLLTGLFFKRTRPPLPLLDPRWNGELPSIGSVRHSRARPLRDSFGHSRAHSLPGMRRGTACQQRTSRMLISSNRVSFPRAPHSSPEVHRESATTLVVALRWSSLQEGFDPWASRTWAQRDWSPDGKS